MIYVDPGNGLFLLQAVASVVLGGIFMARSKIGDLNARIRRALRRNSRDETDQADTEQKQ